MKYEYYINCDERGEFRADVRSETGVTVFDFSNDDQGMVWMIEDGFMRHKNDLNGLYKYLVSMGILTSNDSLVKGN